MKKEKFSEEKMNKFINNAIKHWKDDEIQFEEFTISSYDMTTHFVLEFGNDECEKHRTDGFAIYEEYYNYIHAKYESKFYYFIYNRKFSKNKYMLIML